MEVCHSTKDNYFHIVYVGHISRFLSYVIFVTIHNYFSILFAISTTHLFSIFSSSCFPFWRCFLINSILIHFVIISCPSFFRSPPTTGLRHNKWYSAIFGDFFYTVISVLYEMLVGNLYWSKLPEHQVILFEWRILFFGHSMSLCCIF